MRLDEAKAALERAGYEVTSAEWASAPAQPFPGLFNVEGLGRDLTEGQLVQLAHRHGTWGHAAARAHTAGPTS